MPKLHEMITERRALDRLAEIRSAINIAKNDREVSTKELADSLEKLFEKDIPTTKTYRITVDVTLPFEDDSHPDDIGDQIVESASFSDVMLYKAEVL